MSFSLKSKTSARLEIADAGSIQVDIPLGTANGDLLIAVGTGVAANPVPDVADGWTQLFAETNINPEGSRCMAAWYKVASSESGTYQFDGIAASYIHVQIHRVKDAETATVVGAALIGDWQLDDDPRACPVAAIAEADSLVLWIGAAGAYIEESLILSCDRGISWCNQASIYGILHTFAEFIHATGNATAYITQNARERGQAVVVIRPNAPISAPITLETPRFTLVADPDYCRATSLSVDSVEILDESVTMVRIRKPGSTVVHEPLLSDYDPDTKVLTALFLEGLSVSVKYVVDGDWVLAEVTSVSAGVEEIIFLVLQLDYDEDVYAAHILPMNMGAASYNGLASEWESNIHFYMVGPTHWGFHGQGGGTAVGAKVMLVAGTKAEIVEVLQDATDAQTIFLSGATTGGYSLSNAATEKPYIIGYDLTPESGLEAINWWIRVCKDLGVETILITDNLKDSVNQNYVSTNPHGDLSAVVALTTAFRRQGIKVGLHFWSFVVSDDSPYAAGDHARMQGDGSGGMVGVWRWSEDFPGYLPGTTAVGDDPPLIQEMAENVADYYLRGGFDGGLYFDALDTALAPGGNSPSVSTPYDVNGSYWQVYFFYHVLETLDFVPPICQASMYDTRLFWAKSAYGVADTPIVAGNNSTINTLSSQTEFTLVAGDASETYDDYSLYTIVLLEDASSDKYQISYLAAYNGATKTVRLTAAPTAFTLVPGDRVYLGFEAHLRLQTMNAGSAKNLSLRPEMGWMYFMPDVKTDYTPANWISWLAVCKSLHAIPSLTMGYIYESLVADPPWYFGDPDAAAVRTLLRDYIRENFAPPEAGSSRLSIIAKGIVQALWLAGFFAERRIRPRRNLEDYATLRITVIGRGDEMNVLEGSRSLRLRTYVVDVAYQQRLTETETEAEADELDVHEAAVQAIMDALDPANVNDVEGAKIVGVERYSSDDTPYSMKHLTEDRLYTAVIKVTLQEYREAA